MELHKHFILINGVDKTYQVRSISNNGHQYAIKFLNSDITYCYSKENVVWLTNPLAIELTDTYLYINEIIETNASALYMFGTKYMFGTNMHKFYAVTFHNGFTKHYAENEIMIRRSCLRGNVVNIFNYLKQCANVNTLGLSEETSDNDRSILSRIYSNIDFIDDTTAASVYLNPEHGIKKYKSSIPIFPFGCNASQHVAVTKALSNQISVIQGPPGTGKTQTILNIIANLIIRGKCILIVSNNNSATDNILQKLQNNGLGFLVAPLGNRENKESFINNQPRINPEIISWQATPLQLSNAKTNVESSLECLTEIFTNQERLAQCRQELSEVKIESQHFEKENPIGSAYSTPHTKSDKILDVIERLKSISFYSSDNNSSKFFKKVSRLFSEYLLKIMLRNTLGLKEKLTKQSIPKITNIAEFLFYRKRIAELELEIKRLEESLNKADAGSLLKSLVDASNTILKSIIADKYNKARTLISSVSDIYHNGSKFLSDYPVVLSTTFSAKQCFDNETLFDYVIMDEASQVAIDTGFLALTCAKNAVIVGDKMQLPNVVTAEDELKFSHIIESYQIPDSYNCIRHSFLSSVIATIPNVPETLLREHYRCHPDIINFCNQKFYGGNLIIMTKRTEGDSPLLAITTSEGQHCRGHYNQREIDVVKSELIPILGDPSEIGIIAPYNSQVSQFQHELPSIESATVHKYQGREKDTIILSVTDDTITEFTDNANLLNVAVSRAKKKFCLVVSGNQQELQGNIHDLLGYIRYNKGTIIKSKLHSIYDYLFSTINANRSSKISDYESENLTYDLIESIKSEYPQLSHIKVLCHYPLRHLISNTNGLSDDEIKYATHPLTHIDFLVINRVSKVPLLAIETDGYSFHNETTKQATRDKMKDRILSIYGLPLLRLSTVGHSEKERIVEALLK